MAQKLCLDDNENVPSAFRVPRWMLRKLTEIGEGIGVSSGEVARQIIGGVFANESALNALIEKMKQERNDRARVGVAQQARVKTIQAAMQQYGLTDVDVEMAVEAIAALAEFKRNKATKE